MNGANETRRWYSVYSAKTGELITAGTAEMVTDALGYSTINCFHSAIYHSKKRGPSKKYVFEVDPISLDEYNEALQAHRKRKGYKVTRR